MKEYIPTKSTARLIILDGKVIDSIKYKANKNDFRSNEGSCPNTMPATFNKQVQDIAIKSVEALGLDFGGVDLLIFENKAVVAEVNFPCFFARCQLLTKTDISGQMIDFLIKKSN